MVCRFFEFNFVPALARFFVTINPYDLKSTVLSGRRNALSGLSLLTKNYPARSVLIEILVGSRQGNGATSCLPATGWPSKKSFFVSSFMTPIKT